MPGNTCKEAHGYEKVAHRWTRRRSASGPTLTRNRLSLSMHRHERPGVLGRWVALERSRMDEPPGALDVNERAERARVRVEVSELRMDQEFLKKQRPSSGPRIRTGRGLLADGHGGGR